MLADRTTTAERALETGTTGQGGDRTLEIDARRRGDRVRRAAARCTTRGHRFSAISEERGAVDFGDTEVLVVIDPIDGSLNAKRGLAHHALSLAVAAGDDDGRRRVRLRLRLRHQRGVVGAARRRRLPQRRACSTASSSERRGTRRAAGGARHRVGRPALAEGHRSTRWSSAPTGCGRFGAIAPVALPGRGGPLRRPRLAARLPRGRRRRRAADRARGRRLCRASRRSRIRWRRRSTWCRTRRSSPRAPQATLADLEARVPTPVIDWIVAEWIAGRIGRASARRRLPTDRPGADRRRRAGARRRLHRPGPDDARCRRRRASAAASGSPPTSPRRGR